MGNLELDEIKEYSIVLNGFQFVEQNPLGFFEFDNYDDLDKCFDQGKKIDGFQSKGRVVVKEDGFIPSKDENGDNKAKKDLFVVTRAKTRPVLIFQDVEFCKQYHNNVFIIPMQTLKKPERSKVSTDELYDKKVEYYNKIKKRSEDIPHQYYIKTTIDGKETDSVLFLNDARFVHVSTLFGQVEENAIKKEDLDEIVNRVSKMLNFKNIHECEKCEYLRMFDTMKKIIGRVERLEKNA